jgi:Ni2+-binding GTPase involved in maturation of urease and hydrogenase
VKLAIIAGPASVGKTAVVRQIIREFRESSNPAYVKIDVVRAFEDEELREEFGIPTRKVYSGDLCPDHAGIMVLQDALFEMHPLHDPVIRYRCSFGSLGKQLTFENGADDCSG